MGYRTGKVARPAGRGSGTMLTAMPFSSGRAMLGPRCDFRTIRLRHIAEDRTIGNLVADAGLLAPVLGRHHRLRTDTSLRDPRAGDRYLLRSDRLGRSQKTDHTFMYKLWAPHTPDAPASWPS